MYDDYGQYEEDGQGFVGLGAEETPLSAQQQSSAYREVFESNRGKGQPNTQNYGANKLIPITDGVSDANDRPQTLISAKNEIPRVWSLTFAEDLPPEEASIIFDRYVDLTLGNAGFITKARVDFVRGRTVRVVADSVVVEVGIRSLSGAAALAEQRCGAFMVPGDPGNAVRPTRTVFDAYGTIADLAVDYITVPKYASRVHIMKVQYYDVLLVSMYAGTVAGGLTLLATDPMPATEGARWFELPQGVDVIGITNNSGADSAGVVAIFELGI